MPKFGRSSLENAPQFFMQLSISTVTTNKKKVDLIQMHKCGNHLAVKLNTSTSENG
jgi:hypothetical protein